MSGGDTRFFAIIVGFISVVAGVTYGLGVINQGLKDGRCHNATIISDYRVFNGTNTQYLYDAADHFLAYNGTTIAHIARQGWYLVKVAPDSIGAPYPLLGFKFETLRVCK